VYNVTIVYTNYDIAVTSLNIKQTKSKSNKTFLEHLLNQAFTFHQFWIFLISIYIIHVPATFRLTQFLQKLKEKEIVLIKSSTKSDKRNYQVKHVTSFFLIPLATSKPRLREHSQIVGIFMKYSLRQRLFVFWTIDEVYDLSKYYLYTF